MTPQSSFRSCWRHLMATRMWLLVLPAVILQSCIGSVSGDTFQVYDDERNYSIDFNGSHILYYGSYYDENSTFYVDYSPYETPATTNFNGSVSNSFHGLLLVFFGLLHLLHFLQRDIRI